MKIGLSEKTVQKNIFAVVPLQFARSVHAGGLPAESVSELHQVPLSETSTASITIATSIAPFDLGKQKYAVNSWLRLGFKVVSLNIQKEINQLQEKFPGVRFIRVTRDGRNLVGKPCVYIDDMLAALKQSSDHVVGIVNSDIIIGYLNREAAGCFLYGSRIDINGVEDVTGRVYSLGFDFFFFDDSSIDHISSTDFMLGIPWWDYWLPSVALLNDIHVKRIDTPFGYHLRHEINYSTEQFFQFARKFRRHCGKASFVDLYQQCVDGNYGNICCSVLAEAVLDYLARNSERIYLPGPVVRECKKFWLFRKTCE